MKRKFACSRLHVLLESGLRSSLPFKAPGVALLNHGRVVLNNRLTLFQQDRIRVAFVIWCSLQRDSENTAKDITDAHASASTRDGGDEKLSIELPRHALTAGE